ncbi:MAG: hypothetical protein ACIARR_11305 [Phycisphaerales bacterium JB059]
MSGRERFNLDLEARLRAEAPSGGGLSEEARGRLNERLARTAPEPGASVPTGGRGVVIGGVALLGLVVGVVVWWGGTPRRAAEPTPVVERGAFDPAFGAGLSERVRRFAGEVGGESPLLEEARRIAVDLNALRGMLVDRASVLDLRGRSSDG